MIPVPDGLQWGRDQLIAGLEHGTEMLGARCFASMGPRSIDRGTDPNTGADATTTMLQWGRDQLIAGLFDLVDPPMIEARLQWGRDQLIAGLPAMG